jgi:hypothetical protein
MKMIQAQEAQLTEAGEVFNKLVQDLQTQDNMIDEDNNVLRAQVESLIAVRLVGSKLMGLLD